MGAGAAGGCTKKSIGESDRFRDELKLAARYGLPLSALDSWDTEDIDAGVALVAWEADLGPHGQPLSESISPDADPKNSHGQYFYRAGLPIVDPETGATVYAPEVDYAEKARRDAEDAYRKTLGPNQTMNGLFFPVVKVPRQRRDIAAT